MNRLKPIAASVSSASVAPVKPSAPRERARQRVADQAAGRERQLGGEAVQPQALERRAGEQAAAKNPPSAAPRRKPSMRR